MPMRDYLPNNEPAPDILRFQEQVLSPTEKKKSLRRLMGFDKPLNEKQRSGLSQAGTELQAYKRYLETFRPEFAGAKIRKLGEMESELERRGLGMGIMSKGQGEWWRDYQKTRNQLRHSLFGSAMTEAESREWDKQDVNVSQDPGYVKNALTKELKIMVSAAKRSARSMIDSGFDRDSIESALGPDAMAVIRSLTPAKTAEDDF